MNEQTDRNPNDVVGFMAFRLVGTQTLTFIVKHFGTLNDWERKFPPKIHDVDAVPLKGTDLLPIRRLEPMGKRPVVGVLIPETVSIQTAREQLKAYYGKDKCHLWMFLNDWSTVPGWREVAQNSVDFTNWPPYEGLLHDPWSDPSSFLHRFIFDDETPRVKGVFRDAHPEEFSLEEAAEKMYLYYQQVADEEAGLQTDDPGAGQPDEDFFGQTARLAYLRRMRDYLQMAAARDLGLSALSKLLVPMQKDIKISIKPMFAPFLEDIIPGMHTAWSQAEIDYFMSLMRDFYPSEGKTPEVPQSDEPEQPDSKNE